MRSVPAREAECVPLSADDLIVVALAVHCLDARLAIRPGTPRDARKRCHKALDAEEIEALKFVRFEELLKQAHPDKLLARRTHAAR